MTASQQPPEDSLSVARRYYLSTLGVPSLTASGGEVVLGSHGHHRRRLALLAVLAVAGERGRTRDQLLVLFWPEATQSRARHSLDQLLYALRGALGESVFTSANPVRLNPDVVASDVAAFAAAVERDDLDAVIRLYRGPFLDGFYLEDAAEFEEWAELERARLAAKHAQALERKAQKATAMRDWDTAVTSWQRLTQLERLSSKYAAGLIHALVASGNRAEAVRVAERYEAFVSEELGGRDDAAATSLKAEIRSVLESVSVSEPIFAGTPARSPNDGPLGPTRRPRRAPYIIGVVATTVILGAVAYLNSPARAHPKPDNAERTIAVLPLTNTSRAATDAPLADGLTEEIIAVLAHLPGVRVAARTSAAAFKNSDLDVRRIGDSLGVDYVLEGGVQKAADRLRVQVRLVDAHTGVSRWSETYDRDLGDVFSMQTDIAEAVARELGAALSGDARGAVRRVATRNPAAHELYLRGNDPSTTRGDSASRAGLEYLRQAVALDSQYAAAYAGIARLLLTRINGGWDTTRARREVIAAAESAAGRAIALDSALPEAHLALAGVRRTMNDLRGAEVEVKRAIALDPTNPRFHEWLVQNYAWSGQPVEALAEAQRAVALDPLSPNAIAELGHALLVNDRCDEALKELARLRSLRPPLLRVGDYAAQCYIRKRMWPEALAELERNVAAGGQGAEAVIGFVYARAGQPDRARAILSHLLDRARGTDVGAIDVATVYAGLGEKDQAFRWIEKASQEAPQILFGRLSVIVPALAPDPRLDRLRERFGIQKW